MAQETKSFNIAFNRDFTIMINFPKVGITRNNAKPLYTVEELANWMSKHKPAIQLMGEFNVEEDSDAGYYNERHEEAKELLEREKAPRRRTWVKP